MEVEVDWEVDAEVLEVEEEIEIEVEVEELVLEVEVEEEVELVEVVVPPAEGVKSAAITVVAVPAASRLKPEDTMPVLATFSMSAWASKWFVSCWIRLNPVTGDV